MIKEKTRGLLEPAAWALLAAGFLQVVTGVIALLTANTGFGQLVPFAVRAADARSTFVGIGITAVPVIAVLLATHMGRPVDRARLITISALVVQGVAALGGLVVWLAALGLDVTGFAKLRAFLTTGAFLAVLTVAILFSVTVLRSSLPRQSVDPFAPRTPGAGPPPPPQTAQSAQGGAGRSAMPQQPYGGQWYGQYPPLQQPPAQPTPPQGVPPQGGPPQGGPPPHRGPPGWGQQRPEQGPSGEYGWPYAQPGSYGGQPQYGQPPWSGPPADQGRTPQLPQSPPSPPSHNERSDDDVRSPESDASTWNDPPPPPR